MRRLHLPRHFVVSLLSGLTDELALPHELVPIHVAALVETHFSPRFDLCVLPLPLGRPPSLPHSRILATNSRLPQRLIRASALRRPIRLAALVMFSMHFTIS